MQGLYKYTASVLNCAWTYQPGEETPPLPLGPGRDGAESLARQQRSNRRWFGWWISFVIRFALDLNRLVLMSWRRDSAVFVMRLVHRIMCRVFCPRRCSYRTWQWCSQRAQTLLLQRKRTCSAFWSHYFLHQGGDVFSLWQLLGWMNFYHIAQVMIKGLFPHFSGKQPLFLIDCFMFAVYTFKKIIKEKNKMVLL